MAIAQNDGRPGPFCQEVLGDGVKPGPPGGVEERVFGVDFNDLGRKLEDPPPDSPEGVVYVRNVAVVMAHRPADVNVEVDLGAFDPPPPFPDRGNDPAGEAEEVFPGDGRRDRDGVAFEGLFGRPVGEHPLDGVIDPGERPRFKEPDPVAEFTEVGGFEYQVKDWVSRLQVGDRNPSDPGVGLQGTVSVGFLGAPLHQRGIGLDGLSQFIETHQSLRCPSPASEAPAWPFS